jgi:hypothetical protein
MNYIWDLEARPKKMLYDAHQAIKREYTWLRSTLPENVIQLCGILDEQLAEGSEIEVEGTLGQELRSIRHLYKGL